jgi:hypothetical protein
MSADSFYAIRTDLRSRKTSVLYGPYATQADAESALPANRKGWKVYPYTPEEIAYLLSGNAYAESFPFSRIANARALRPAVARLPLRP